MMYADFYFFPKSKMIPTMSSIRSKYFFSPNHITISTNLISHIFPSRKKILFMIIDASTRYPATYELPSFMVRNMTISFSGMPWITQQSMKNSFMTPFFAFFLSCERKCLYDQCFLNKFIFLKK